jgi:hypothetical protein
MSTVYQHQLHSHKVRRWHPKRWLVVGGIVVLAGVIYGVYSLRPDTVINNAAPTIRQIKNDTHTQTFRRGTFSIDLPTGWQFTAKQQDTVTIYHFRSTLPGEAGNRLLDVYEDGSLPTFAINRMIPVSATDDGRLVVETGEVSDNCSAYTTGATTNRVTVGQLAKWQGVEFMCDMANPLRNVVGTGSKDGINTVRVSDQGGQRHSYFLTYTENNSKPDYSIFIAAINSFKLTE